MLAPYKCKEPSIDDKSFIIGKSFLSGDLEIKEYASIWPGVVARADVDKIVIGRYSNVQDNAVLHCDPGSPLLIGDHVTVGHSAVLHGCTIKNRVLIGIGAIILSGAVVQDDVMIGAGSLVTGGKILESGKLYLGAPARAIRDLKPDELEHLKKSAFHYVEIARGYVENNFTG